jgi:hypothetical protein
MSNATRIVLVGLEVLLADVLEDCLNQETGLCVVGRLPERVVLLTNGGGALNADAMVCSLEPEAFARFCERVLRKYPDLLALSIAPGRQAVLQCRLEAQVVTYGNASLADLARIIRESKRRTL